MVRHMSAYMHIYNAMKTLTFLSC